MEGAEDRVTTMVTVAVPAEDLLVPRPVLGQVLPLVPPWMAAAVLGADASSMVLAVP